MSMGCWGGLAEGWGRHQNHRPGPQAGLSGNESDVWSKCLFVLEFGVSSPKRGSCCHSARGWVG